MIILILKPSTIPRQTGEVTASNELDEGAVDELTGWERTWLGLWGEGRWWSEYTLYSIVLHEHALFDELHVKRYVH